MSLSLEGQTSPIDASTGLHEDVGKSNINTAPPPNTGSALGGGMIKTLGNMAPLIRINDRYLTSGDIMRFELHNDEFIPYIVLEIFTQNNDLIKSNTIKDGDKCSVFIQQDNDMLKSYRADYRITDVTLLGQNKTKKNDNVGVHMLIEAELFIPSLYDWSKTFSFVGTSYAALMDVSEKMGLGFFFCDEDDTNDTQVWYCVGNGRGKNSPYIKYIKNIAKHAYKDFKSFYDCWIDIRYGLTFLNINKMLGAEGLDEKVDLSFFNNAMTNAISVNGSNIDESSSKKTKKFTPKIFTNIRQDATSMTEFYVMGCKEIVDNSLSSGLGMYAMEKYRVKNAGMSKAENQLQFKANICVNQDKLDHGFYILGGPGQNKTYVQAETGDFAEQHMSVTSGGIATTQSDEDANMLKQTGSNMLSSGNTHKMSNVAKKHNELNNQWLNKKVIEVELNGKNFQIMRGEKIPVLMQDVTGRVNMGQSSEYTDLSMMYETYSGWFIIKSIVWKYNINKQEGNSGWTTVVDLARREWPIIGWTEKTDQAVQNETTANSGTGSLSDMMSGITSGLNLNI